MILSGRQPVAMSADYFGYDALKRVTSIAEQTYRSNGNHNYATFTQSFSYDRFGNRLVSASNVTGVPNPGFKIVGANNRLIATPDVTGNSGSGDRMQYDATGNLIQDTWTQTGAGTRTYDAENRMLTAYGSANTLNSYTYNADGRRTRRSLNNGNEVWWQVFGLDGELVAEYELVSGTPTLRKEYGYRSGQLLVIAEAASSNCQWLVSDALGTPRILADQTGSLAGVKRRDYLPFGEEILAGVGHRTTTNGYSGAQATQPRQQFTGKERDNETGLDYFEARYYGAVYGRFTSPDEFTGGADELYDFAATAADNPTFYADLIEPHSLNKYVYCYNNPLVYIDADGHQASGKEQLKQNTQDFLLGVAKGVGASLTFGICEICNPKPTDSPADRAGQIAGTTAVGATGTNIAFGGTAVTVGSGGTLGIVAAPTAVGGLVMVAGASKNAAALATTPLQMSSNQPQNSGKEESKHVFGQNGTRTTSTTVGNGKGWRVDVENPNPGQRPGQVHYQSGKIKYLYNPETKTFGGASKTENKNLLNNPEIQKAIEKGLKVLGESQ